MLEFSKKWVSRGAELSLNRAERLPVAADSLPMNGLQRSVRERVRAEPMAAEFELKNGRKVFAPSWITVSNNKLTD